MPANLQSAGTPLIVSLIIGNGWTHGRVNKYKKHFPSVTGILSNSMKSFDMSEGNSAKSLTWDNVPFVWGEEVNRSARMKSAAMGSDKIGGVTYQRLLIAAFYELFGAVDVTADILITTLPVMDYQHQRENMRVNLAGTYEVYDTNGSRFVYDIRPDAVKVLPEGLPTVYDFIYNENLVVQNDALLSQSVGVVNIGTYTTDLIKISEQRPELANCTSTDNGLSKVWEGVQRYAKMEHGKNLTEHEADEATKKGGFYVGNKWVSIDNLTESLFEQLAESIAQSINPLWDGARDIQSMLLVGGGAPQTGGFIHERYKSLCTIESHGHIEDSASTDMNGAHKFARIRTMQNA